MSGSNVLEVVIGLAFIYLLYSLLATIFVELFSDLFRLRALFLKRAIRRMLSGNAKAPKQCATNEMDLPEAFFNEPGLQLQGRLWARFPSYLKKETFSKSLLDLLGRRPDLSRSESVTISLEEGKATALNDIFLPEEEANVSISPITQSQLKSLLKHSEDDLELFKLGLEDWFEQNMERLSGLYKRWISLGLLVIGLGLAAGFNVDTIAITKKLSENEEVRTALVEKAISSYPEYKEAIDSLKDSNLANVPELEKRIQADINGTNDIISLEGRDWSLLNWFGWFLTALAISFGAPFWFDLLGKLIRVRSSIPTATKSKKKKQGNAEDPAEEFVG